MSAKEMFEKLGYEQKIRPTFIEYYDNDETKFVWFDKSHETIEVPEYDINMQLLQAINKQVEELGWLGVDINEKS